MTLSSRSAMKILYGILPVVLLGLNAVHAQGVVTSTVSIDVGTCGPFSTVPVGGSSNGVPGSGSNNTVIGGGPSGIPGGSGDIPGSNTYVGIYDLKYHRN